MLHRAEAQSDHIGALREDADLEHELERELERRLEFLWECDQHIDNAAGHDEVQQLWRELRAQEQETVNRIKNAISQEVSVHSG